MILSHLKKTLFASALLACACAVHAQLWLFEPFDYPAGAAANGANGGQGFNGAWRSGTGTRGDGNIWTSGLTFGELATSGNALIVDLLKNEGNKSISIYRKISKPAPASEPVWVSFLCRFEKPADDQVYDNATVFVRVASGADRSIKYRTQITDRRAVIQQGGDVRNMGQSAPMAISPEKTYLVVAYFPPKAEGEKSLVQRADASCSLWVLEGGLPKAMQGNLPQALDSLAIAKATAPALNESIDAGDILHVGLWGRSTTQFSTFVDELRYGTQVADVLPKPATQP